jgi:hypothetical protein
MSTSLNVTFINFNNLKEYTNVNAYCRFQICQRLAFGLVVKAEESRSRSRGFEPSMIELFFMHYQCGSKAYDPKEIIESSGHH